ncbi:MAG: hypothetical protein D6753_15945 [Planctomycetota bacterium]|nr:MAG: hypothetical protein D6753_15945 [Planctomycetota bacterium]
MAAALSRSLQLTAAQASEAIAQFPAARLRSAEVLACLQSEAARLRSQIDLTRRAHAETFGQAPIARTLIVGGGASQPLLADMLRGCEF